MSFLRMRAMRSVARLAAPRTSSIITAAPASFRTGFAQVSLTTRLSASHFSTSIPFKNITENLVTKLQSEIEFETEASEENAETPYTEHFQALSFEVQDTPGQEEVVLTREYNGEQIKITFSVSDIHHATPEIEETEFTEEQASATEPEAENPEDLENVSFACRVNIQVTKPGKEGVLHINAVAEDGEFLIDTMPFYGTATEATTSSTAAEDDGQYIGPPFTNLDEDLQVLMTQYLEERGVNTDLALLIPEYIDWKEQSEYIKWLKNIKEFIQN